MASVGRRERRRRRRRRSTSLPKLPGPFGPAEETAKSQPPPPAAAAAAAAASSFSSSSRPFPSHSPLLPSVQRSPLLRFLSPAPHLQSAGGSSG
eukprot:758133-Hanusia_phi.AAC.3